MGAFGEKAFEPRFRFRHRVGPRDACDIEAARARPFDQRRLDFVPIGQKSRLA
jgi:hypothetical protein